MERNERDAQILQLFEHRSEEAISAATLQYGGLCRQIAMNILGNAEDAEECVNDTWLAVWNRIPPEQPRSLTAYICRNAVNEFLSGQPKEMRQVFVRRYWFGDSLAQLSELTGFTESKLKSMLHRMRKVLRQRLEEEGVQI
ncbi:MAG: RNA polymerase sigma factor [Anaerovoracaceae bacterium]